MTDNEYANDYIRQIPQFMRHSRGGTGERLLSELQGLREIESERSSSVRIPFHDDSTITGTTALTVWDPTPGYKFCLKGYTIVALVKTAIASGPVIFGFWDNAVGTGAIAPICAFQNGDEQGLFFQRKETFGLGIPSSAADRNLVLAPSATIGAGVIQVMGVIWGDHVPA